MDRVRSIATRRVAQPTLPHFHITSKEENTDKKKHKYNYRSTPLTVGFVTHQTNGGGVFSQYFPAVGFLSKMLKELIQLVGVKS